MRLDDFRELVRRLADEVPPTFFDGVAEVVVSPQTVPHPERPGIYTLGECIPLLVAADDAPDGVQSRIVLYHGSFAALAKVTPGFEWREEAFETLTHELRHHLEWRARAPDLEELDWAVEQNYARQDGEAFDPAFYLAGAPVAEDAWQVEDDVFLDRIVRTLPRRVALRWAGREYDVAVPAGATLPAFLELDGVADAPAGELVLVLRRKPGVFALLKPARTFRAAVRVAAPSDYLPGGAPTGGAD